MKHKLLSLLGLTLAILVFFILLRQQIFIVRQLLCVLEDGLSCDDKIANSVLEKTPLLFTDFYQNQALNEILNTQQLQLVDYKIIFPGELQIIVRDEPVIYSLILPDSTRFFVTKSGKIISKSENREEGMSEIVISDAEVEIIGESMVLPNAHSTFVELKRVLEENELELKDLVWKSDHELRVKLKSGQQLVIDPDNITTLSETIPAALQAAARNSSDEKIEIDFRFALPVLRTPQ
ncbi:MAG: hypothetical protein COU65_03030 [Candidatus Pacebacteria bacterium CG10_big_fil_rev_8_21_14_0_10_42_12]|nr:hypothetical protein [Candidatus Paceibacterota bacterium]PIR62518.1 MAG: hypothetical protein COU65_03030 [Candidatus Pacebacteria bacterium CG10_big_fil_rev_8_21_14_0_10_42_12]